MRESPGGRLEKNLKHRQEGIKHLPAGLLVSRPGAGGSTFPGLIYEIYGTNTEGAIRSSERLRDQREGEGATGAGHELGPGVEEGGAQGEACGRTT